MRNTFSQWKTINFNSNINLPSVWWIDIICHWRKVECECFGFGTQLERNMARQNVRVNKSQTSGEKLSFDFMVPMSQRFETLSHTRRRQRRRTLSQISCDRNEYQIDCFDTHWWRIQCMWDCSTLSPASSAHAPDDLMAGKRSRSKLKIKTENRLGVLEHDTMTITCSVHEIHARWLLGIFYLYVFCILRRYAHCLRNPFSVRRKLLNMFHTMF